MNTWLEYLLEILGHPLVVAICVLVVSLSLSYFFALRREKKLKILERHSDELKKLVERWKNEVPPIPDPDKPLMIDPTLQKVPVEEEYLFSDLKNHVPSSSNLLQAWDSYNQLLYLYNKKRFSFTQKILKDIKTKIGLPYTSTWGKELHGFSKNLIEVIFLDLYHVAFGRDQYYLKTEFKIEKREKRWELWCVGNGLAYGTEGETNKARVVIKEFLAELSTSLYVKNFMRLLNEMKQLQKNHEELLRLINDFLSLPLLPHECKYMKLSM